MRVHPRLRWIVAGVVIGLGSIAACARPTPATTAPAAAAPPVGSATVAAEEEPEPAPAPPPSAIVFDYETNLLLGDTDGSVLAMLGSRATELHACLPGLEVAIDRGDVTSVSANLSSAQGRLKSFRLSGAPDPVNECLAAALDGLAFPGPSIMGNVRLRPREPMAEPNDRGEARWTVELDGQTVEMVATLIDLGAQRAVEVSGTIRIHRDRTRGFPGRHPLEVVDEYTTDDGGLVKTGSWSHNEQELPRCLDSSEELPFESMLRELSAGHYVGAELWLITGPCEGPVQTLSLGALWVDWTGDEPAVHYMPRWRHRLQESPGDRMQREARERMFSGG